MISGGLTPANVQAKKDQLCKVTPANSDWNKKCETAIVEAYVENSWNDLDLPAYEAVAKRCEVDNYSTKTNAITAKCAALIMGDRIGSYPHGHKNALRDYSNPLDFGEAAANIGIGDPQGKSFIDIVRAAKQQTLPSEDAIVSADAASETPSSDEAPDAASAVAPEAPSDPSAEAKADDGSASPSPAPAVAPAGGAPDDAASAVAPEPLPAQPSPYGVAPAPEAPSDPSAKAKADDSSASPSPAPAVAPAGGAPDDAASAPAVALATLQQPNKTTGKMEFVAAPSPEGSDSPAYLSGNASLSIPIDVALEGTLSLNGGLAYEKKPSIGRNYNETFALINALDAGSRALNGTLYLAYEQNLGAVKMIIDGKEVPEFVGNLEVGQIHRSAIETTGAGIKGGVVWNPSKALTGGATLYLGSASSYENLLEDDARGFNSGGTTASLNLNATWKPLKTDGSISIFNDLTLKGFVAKDIAGDNPSKDPGALWAQLKAENPFSVGEATPIKLTPSVAVNKLKIDDQTDKTFVVWELMAEMGKVFLKGALTYRNGQKMDQTVTVDPGTSLDEPATGSEPITGPVDYTLGGDQKELLLQAGYIFDAENKTMAAIGFRWWQNQEEQAVSFPGGSDEIENIAGSRYALYGMWKTKF